MKIRAGFNIRTKLLLVALLLFLIPWMSYVYVRDLKSFLLSGQEDALTLTSRAVATVLHDRPELFSQDTLINEEDLAENDIYTYPLPSYIYINGDLSDWGEQLQHVTTYPEQATDSDDHVDHLFGYHGRFIYALFQVVDSNVIFRPREVLRVDAADHIRLTLQNPGQSEQRYTLASGGEGRMSIYSMEKNWQYPSTGQPNYDMAAELQITDVGYNVELRIPRFMLRSDTQVRLSVVDVDDVNQAENAVIIHTTPQSEADNLSRLLVQSPEIAKILKGLGRADARIWVIDDSKRVRTVVGNIATDNASKPLIKPYGLPQSFTEAIQYLSYYYHYTLRKIFSVIVEKPIDNLADHEQSVEQRNDEIIQLALNGHISVDRRPSIDNLGTILMSAHPIYFGDVILGAVVVEQSTNHVLQQQQEVLENVVSVTLLVLLTVIISLLIFASRLTYRIRKLRNAADSAIDRDGRIINQSIVAERRSSDEIGDLSRSMSNMLGRLSQYTNYLKGLPDTLAHEVSNPLNVVNSSLHNLSNENPDVADSKYIERAKNGINRIGSILRNLTEAANLEQAMQNETKETFDLVELVENYMDGYVFSHPAQSFATTIETRPLIVDAAPDYIAQLLDKLIDNAIDFAADKSIIVVRVKKIDGFVKIDVINEGAYLPEGMSERIFEPLVSLGRKDAQKTRLGMGLYVVKLIADFHGGEVMARNLNTSPGVMISFTLPLAQLQNQTW